MTQLFFDKEEDLRAMPRVPDILTTQMLMIFIGTLIPTCFCFSLSCHTAWQCPGGRTTYRAEYLNPRVFW